MTSIKGFENYVIFEDGVIINIKSGKEMKSHLDIDDGYYRIYLCKDGKDRCLRIHRLLALAFIPNPDNKPCVDHINRDREDNRIENLRWATYSENRRNRSCISKCGLQFISKQIDKKMKQGFTYRFQIKRPELYKSYTNKDLEVILEYRNKFCTENGIEINDKVLL